MRPVNLIPTEERRGETAPMRTGPLAYAIVGLLVIVLAAVAAITLLDNKVSDRKAEVATLEQRSAEAQAQVESLASFTTFQQVHDARVQTVQSLATSRFDWERVLHELSRVLPEHIWLTEVTGTVSPEAGVSGGGGGSSLRSNVTGPALELVGCGRSQSDVARLVAAMEDIDGVTRVTAGDSAKADGPSGGSGSCQTRPSIPTFHLTAAFDGVVADASTTATADTTTTATTTEPGATTTDSSTAETGTTTTDSTAATGSDPVTDPGTPSAGQQRRIDTGKSIVGAGG